MSQNKVEGETDTTRTEDTNRESEHKNIPSAATDTEIAAESPQSRTAEAASDEDDVLHDLRESFSRTASLGKRPTLRRKDSARGLTRPLAPRRVQSMNAGGHARSVGRTKSGDLSSMPTLLQQGNPRPPLLQRPPAPSRTKSSSSSSTRTFNRVKPVRTSSDSLRTMRRDQLVNTALERKEQSQSPTKSHMRGSPPGKQSVATFRGDSLESCFSVDSETMRKQQLIADPLDDGTYYENDSAADHDESFSHFSEYSAEPREVMMFCESGGDDSLSHLGGGEGRGRGGSFDTFCTFDSHRLGGMQIHGGGVDQACDISLCSNNSFGTLDTADVGVDDLGGTSIIEEEEEAAGLCGLDDLDKVGESDLCDSGESRLGERKELKESSSNVSVACVSIEADAVNVD
jgi:hypothetical protein